MVNELELSDHSFAGPAVVMGLTCYHGFSREGSVLSEVASVFALRMTGAHPTRSCHLLSLIALVSDRGGPLHCGMDEQANKPAVADA